MKIITPIDIGKITIKSLRDFILDNDLTDNDTILLSQVDFDELAFEHKETYKQSLIEPYLIIGVLIKEHSRILANKIGIVKDDSESIRFIPEPVYDESDIVYRCGYCGNVVDYDGEELTPGFRQANIELLEKFGAEVVVKHVTGFCCRNQES